MKIVRVRVVILIFSSLITIPLLMFSLFSLSQSFTEHHNINLLEPNYKVLTVTKSSRLVLFLAFIITFSSLGRRKTCHEDFEYATFPSSPSTYEFVSTDMQSLCCHCDLDQEEDVNDDDHYDNNDGYIVEYVDEDYGNHEDEDDDELLCVEDFEVTNECNEDKCTDLEKRAEEFIAKVTEKWKEESLSERLLLLAAA